MTAVLYSRNGNSAQPERQGRDHRPARSVAPYQSAPLGKNVRAADDLSLDRRIPHVHGSEAREPRQPSVPSQPPELGCTLGSNAMAEGVQDRARAKPPGRRGSAAELQEEGAQRTR